MMKRKTQRPINYLPDRSEVMSVPEKHLVLDNPMTPPFPERLEQAIVGMGCFWGVERLFWNMDGVYTTSVGYAGGVTKNPTYKDVCSGRTGHAEVAMIVFDPSKTPFTALLKVFWENHNPTQGMRQGNDIGTQYRSVLFYMNEDQRVACLESRREYQQELSKSGLGEITTKILPAPDYYFAEEYHQQYLEKVPGGYCGLKGTGVACVVDTVKST